MTNLEWLYNKIKSTGCVQLLLDINLTSPPKRRQSEPQSPVSSRPHIDFLLDFLRVKFKPLNYDAQQLYSLLFTSIVQHSAKLNQLAHDPIVQQWKKSITESNLPIIQNIKDNEQSNKDVEKVSAESNDLGYDFLINANRNENFVISLSTNREEICVWNALT